MNLTDAQLFCNAPKPDSYYYNEDAGKEVPGVRCRLLRQDQPHSGPHKAYESSIKTLTEWDESASPQDGVQ